MIVFGLILQKNYDCLNNIKIKAYNVKMLHLLNIL